MSQEARTTSPPIANTIGLAIPSAQAVAEVWALPRVLHHIRITVHIADPHRGTDYRAGIDAKVMQIRLDAARPT